MNHRASRLLPTVLSVVAFAPPFAGCNLAAAQPTSSASGEGRSVTVYTTAKDSTQRLALSAELRLSEGSQPPETDLAIFVSPDRRYQTFIGIGGALTDASAEVFATLSEDQQQASQEQIAFASVMRGIHW